MSAGPTASSPATTARPANSPPATDTEIVERAGLEPNTAANEFDPEAVKTRRDDSSDTGDAAGSGEAAAPADAADTDPETAVSGAASDVSD